MPPTGSFFGYISSGVTFDGLAFLSTFDSPIAAGESYEIIDNLSVAPIPVPAALPLLITGVGVLGFARRRAPKASAA